MNSMFTVTGQVINTFVKIGQVDKETGAVTPPSSKVQLLGTMQVQSGDSKMELIDLTIEDKGVYEKLSGKTIRVPLGFFAPSKGSIIYYIPKGSKPEIVPLPV